MDGRVKERILPSLLWPRSGWIASVFAVSLKVGKKQYNEVRKVQ
jgi:hypothetical protein